MADVEPDSGVAPVRTAFFLGRSLNKRRRPARGFKHGKTPCHATLAETLRAIDGRALADGLEEAVHLIASAPAGETAPEALLCANRGHWGIAPIRIPAGAKTRYLYEILPRSGKVSMTPGGGAG